MAAALHVLISSPGTLRVPMSRSARNKADIRELVVCRVGRSVERLYRERPLGDPQPYVAEALGCKSSTELGTPVAELFMTPMLSAVWGRVRRQVAPAAAGWGKAAEPGGQWHLVFTL